MATTTTETLDYTVSHDENDIWLEYDGFNLLFAGEFKNLEAEAENAATESGNGYMSHDGGEYQFNASTKDYIEENLRSFAGELLASGRGVVVTD